MDDVWLSSFTANPTVEAEPLKNWNSPVLLQQQRSTGSETGRLSTERTVNGVKKSRPSYPDPPTATLIRRPASFYFQRGIARPQIGPRRTSCSESASSKCSSEVFTAGDPTLQYDAWADALEDELLEKSHEKYLLYHDELSIAQGRLSSLLKSTNETLRVLSSLSESFQSIEAQTSAFQAQCQHLLTEQKRITKLAGDVKENLRYYEYLEPITRRLNAPGSGTLVRAKDFPDMLANLDACLDYMQAHPKQREAATYQSKYRLLLTRSLTLIRVHFTESLRALAADVSQKMSSEKSQNNSTLLYARFRVISPELKQLGLEIQKRCVLPADAADQDREPEYQSLMNELYQSYTATRGRLLLPTVVNKMADIATSEGAKKDLVAFAREAMTYLRGICLDEYNLWHEWFVGDNGVYEFLESICEPLFDYFRPRTIHETKLTKLCELCSFVQTRYMQNDDDGYEDDASDEMALERRANGHAQELDFAALMQPALADAQTRLVFLAQAALRDQIERFKPTPQDLDYPAKAGLVKGKPVPLSGHKKSAMSQSPITPTTPGGGEMNPFETHLKAAMDTQSWYPTLTKAVRLLSRIYRLVNSSVFDDLAHRIVFSTTQSLVSAAAQIKTQVSPTDSNLFLISQLLGLKQQIVAFDIEYVSSEISFDFSRLTDTFYELRDRGGLWNPATWYKLASSGLLPRVVENMLDAKADLDGRLRTAINDLVNGYATSINGPLAEVKAGDDAKRGENAIDPRRAATAVRGLAEKEVADLRHKLNEYIADSRTKETLVAAVRDQVVLAYEEWVVNIEDAHDGSGKIGKVSRKGKGREDEVWASSVFAEWCEKTFASGQPD